MRQINPEILYKKLLNKSNNFPLSGQLELTYRCVLNCVHCYCKGSERPEKELDTRQWKNVIREIRSQGSIWICLTGGDPLLRKDFLEIYSYAKKCGFIITLYTNGLLFTDEIIAYLEKSPPFFIEITINGITPATYAKVTGREGYFARLKENLNKLKQKKLPLALKSIGLKENKKEILRIKEFAGIFFGRLDKGRHFNYDFMVYPRLNGDMSPCFHRLNSDEIMEVGGIDAIARNVYHCSFWQKQFSINPYGKLKFCVFSDKAVDLKTTPFQKGIPEALTRFLKEKSSSGSRCKDCRLRPICRNCPVTISLRKGCRDPSTPYYCQWAEEMARDAYPC